MLTLFALVLAIGIVVDDAIVVVEAVHVNMSDYNLSPKDATIKTMKDISGAIITITMVMSAVFIPVAFLSGPVGVFYRQFSITLAIAIILSGIVALTLTPTLTILLLKKHDPQHVKTTWLTKFYALFNKQYNRSEIRYKYLVGNIAGRKLLTISILIAFFIATWGISSILPSGFIPTEDQSMIYVNLVTPPGSTLDRTSKAIDALQTITKQVPEVDNITTLAGYSIISDAPGASYGFAMINLKPTIFRQKSIYEIIEDLKSKSTTIKDATIEFFPPPTVAGFGNTSGFELRLIDKTGKGNIPATAAVTNRFIDSLKTSPAIASAFTNFDASFPQYLLHIDNQLAAQKGITVKNAMDNLQILIGGYYATNFIRFGQMYKVMVQSAPEYRANPEDILTQYTKNDKGEMVPYSSFIKMERVYGPEQLTRYNMYTSALISGDAAEGYSSGQAINEINSIANRTLPKGYEVTFSGMTREQILAGNQTVFIFAISLIFVYLLLSAQYENFLLPLIVILSLPAGIFGTFFLLKITGLENNIYAQVAMIMLIGLLGKNAILIVEFALQKEKEGFPIIQAAQLGAAARLRPIIMTSIAFIAGLLPLCFSHGAGALGNRSIGIASAGGMFIGTFVGLLLVPGLYVIFSSLSNKITSKKSTSTVQKHHD
jgi:HAE1 family hydrophobic/amphiphilic exporter-1